MPGRNGTKWQASSVSLVHSDLPVRVMQLQVLDLRADRRHQAAADGQLLEQCTRHLETGRRKDDAVEWRDLREPKHTISVLQAQVGDAQRPQIGLGELVQGLDALDRIHLLRHAGQHGRLVAAAGADLEHALQRLAAVACSNSIMRATMYGWEMVWLWPIGSETSI